MWLLLMFGLHRLHPGMAKVVSDAAAFVRAADEAASGKGEQRFFRDARRRINYRIIS